MEPFEPHLSLLTALAVGLLIGLEREQAKPETGGAAFAGIRTYPLFALVGALAMMLGPASIWLPLVALAGVITLVGISYAVDIRKGNDHGVTTEVSAIATYLLGALAASRGVIEPLATRLLLVVALGVTMTFLLSSKKWLHGFAARVSKEDVFATVKFLIVATIVLPLLPREPMGPLDAINPFSVGLMIVLISGMSFVGYVAMRLLGKNHGLLLSAAVGGLASSTALTIAAANRTKQEPDLAPAGAASIAIASAIMVGRVAVLVTITSASLLQYLAFPLVGAALGAVVGALLVYRHTEATPGAELEVGNPFDLGNAIRFGLVFAVVLFAVKAARVYLGDQGVYLAALVAGGTDVDAVTLSTAAQLGTEAPRAAMIAIIIAVAANTIVKSALAAVIAGRALGRRAFLVGGTIIVGAVAGLVPALTIN